MCDYFTEVEAARGLNGAPLQSIEKCGRTKTVSITEVGRVGVVNKSNATWMWSVKARQRYDQAVLDEGAAFAQAS
jgi:hypothetical protein